MTLDECLVEMHRIYRQDPTVAVRGQGFIKELHRHVAVDLRDRISPTGKRQGITVQEEVRLYGSHKPKDVDVAVVDPSNGPLLIVGLRSQMSSVANNALNYYEGIIGECISLQDRFPMSVIGYIYLMPLTPVKAGRTTEVIDHGRYARMYAAITNRGGQRYQDIRGIYDQFAYLIVDFNQDPPQVRDAIAQAAAPAVDLSMATFVNRMVDTFKERNLFLDLFT